MTDLFPEATPEELIERRRKRYKYKPVEVARILTERFAHKVTAEVIRKWDNYILSGIKPKDARAKGVNRAYSELDLEYFNLIAVLRNMGYSLGYIKEELPSIREKSSKHPFVVEVMNRLARQREAFFHVQELLTTFKGGDE